MSVSDIIGIIYFGILVFGILFLLICAYKYDKIVKIQRKKYLDSLTNEQKGIILSYLHCEKISFADLFKKKVKDDNDR